MTKKRRLPAFAASAFLGLLCVHFALNATFPSRSDAISYGFFVFWSIMASAACIWKALRSSGNNHRNWAFLSSAFLLWFAATVLAARAQFFQHASPASASLDDFFYFFYGVPILLAIAAPDDAGVGSLFLWLDALQAVAVGFLAYTALFAVLPFSGGPQHPLPVARLIGIYDLENFALALLAAVRLLATPRRSAEQRFFSILTAYLWIYAISAGVYNHIVANATNGGLFDALVDLPFAVFTFCAFLAWPPAHIGFNLRRRKPLALFIDNARPILLGLALVSLSGWIGRSHFTLAISTIFGAFGVYGLRSAMLQGRYSTTQAALEQARERLEQLVLQDGLTGIANRRCFDERFRNEWARARRSGTSLSLLVIDIDHFKKLNDTHGHLLGDECLIQVARTLQMTLSRPGDLLARYGGEEFVALLPDTRDSGAFNVAERLQGALSRTEPPPPIERQVTISIGVTTWDPPQRCTAEQMLETADRALYLAKQNGRNRTEYLALSPSQSV